MNWKCRISTNEQRICFYKCAYFMFVRVLNQDIVWCIYINLWTAAFNISENCSNFRNVTPKIFSVLDLGQEWFKNSLALIAIFVYWWPNVCNFTLKHNWNEQFQRDRRNWNKKPSCCFPVQLLFSRKKTKWIAFVVSSYF